MKHKELLKDFDPDSITYYYVYFNKDEQYIDVVMHSILVGYYDLADGKFIDKVYDMGDLIVDYFKEMHKTIKENEDYKFQQVSEDYIFIEMI